MKERKKKHILNSLLVTLVFLTSIFLMNKILTTEVFACCDGLGGGPCECDYPSDCGYGDDCVWGCCEDGGVDCECSWSSYGSCSKSCGGGERCKEMVCNYSGCPGNGDEDCMPCNTQPCCSCGAWSAWSACTKPCYDLVSYGTQTRTRTCTPSGCNTTTETQNCNTQICTGDVTGNMWNDLNYNNTPDSNEYWTGSPATVCSSITSSLQVLYSGGNIISSWGCNPNSYYQTTNSVNMGTQTLNLGNLPSNYSCSNVLWTFLNKTTGVTQTGNSCSASVNVAKDSGNNNLTWRLRRECEIPPTYDLTVNVNKLPDDTSELTDEACPGTPIEGIYVSVSPVTGDTSKTTSSGGIALYENVSTTTSPVKTFEASGSLTTGETVDVYQQVCPRVRIFQKDLGDDARYCKTPEVNLGVSRIRKYGWVSAIDADVFAGSIAVAAPLGTGSEPGGFEKVVVNSKDGTTGGYIFSKADSTTLLTPLDHLYENNLGGIAYNLEGDGRPSHDSKWLDKFTLDPPTHNEVVEIESVSDFPVTFTNGMVYKIDYALFNDILDNVGDLNYSVSSDGLAILYVTDDSGDPSSDALIIERNIKSTNDGRIIIISKPQVLIAKEIGIPNPLVNYKISNIPNIMASLISANNITFESYESDPASDTPIMLTAPLVSKTGLVFSRDLGHDINAVLPAQSVLSNNKYLYLLSSLEKTKSTDFLYYTGLTLTTYDLDWEYIY